MKGFIAAIAAALLLLAAPAWADLSVPAGPLIGTISLSQQLSTGVTPGTYTCPTITVNISGHITSASNGTCSGSGGSGNEPFTVAAAPTGVAATDTANLQATFAAGGKVLLPPSATCYQVTSLNLVNVKGLIVEGSGQQSCINVAGSDAAGNWLDFSGASHIALRDFDITGPSTSVPKNLILWAQTTTSSTVKDFSIENVNVTAGSSVAGFYGYGFLRLAMSHVHWIQTYAGPSQSDPSLKTTVARLDAENSGGATSANATLASGQTSAIETTFTDVWLMDLPSGYGSGVQDNDAALTCVTCGQLEMNGGGIESLGAYDLVLWWYAEGLAFHGTTFAAADGSINTTWFVEIGGGTNGELTFDTDLFSVPISAGGSGAPFSISQPVTSRMAGMAVYELKIINPDVGGTFSGEHMISLDFPCNSTTGYSPWLQQSEVEAPNMSVVMCGSVTPSTTFRGVSLVIMGMGTNSAGASWGPP